MAPSPGTIHRHARHDSSLIRLWPWARRQRQAWPCSEAADAIDASPRRLRALLAVLAQAGLLERVQAWTPQDQEPHLWALTDTGRCLPRAPVVIVRQGCPVGVRLP